VNACDEANVRVEFERSDIGFAVIFYRPLNHINTDDSINENIANSIVDKDISIVDNANSIVDNGISIVDNANSIVDNANSIVDNDGSIAENGTNGATASKIIALMQEHPYISANTLAQSIGISPRNIQAHIKALKKQGLIGRIGSPKGGHWVVYQPGGKQNT
jgi:DNA-binding transcriptional ArsR family regulator